MTLACCGRLCSSLKLVSELEELGKTDLNKMAVLQDLRGNEVTQAAQYRRLSWSK